MSLIQVSRLDGQQTHGESVFPKVYTADSGSGFDACQSYVREHRQELMRLATEHGAILFRDIGVADVDGFDTVVRCLELENFPYNQSLSNAVRINRTERVFSANEAPPEVQIFFHHEMAQTPLYPRWILFSCEIAAESGGATPLCRSDILYQRLRGECPEFVNACETRGLRYSNVMPSDDDPGSGMGRSWRSTLGVEDEAAAELRLNELGYTWDWQDDGCLRVTTPALPAVMQLADGRRTFFNQLIAAFCGWKDDRNDPSKAIQHGDGTVLDAEAVGQAAAIADDLTFLLQWQVGDVALLDNTVVMHARQPFSGKRKVVASLAQMECQSFEPIAN